jgi:predicted nucleic acid-binding protein
MSDKTKVFFDSNILIYFADGADPQKQLIAENLIKNAVINDTGVISTQSLQEFFAATTRKLLCTKEKAKEYIENFSESFTVEQVSVPLILKAINISIKNQFSFWDSLILAAAIQTGCIICYSEDLTNGQIVDGVKILNPFTS